MPAQSDSGVDVAPSFGHGAVAVIHTQLHKALALFVNCLSLCVASEGLAQPEGKEGERKGEQKAPERREEPKGERKGEGKRGEAQPDEAPPAPRPPAPAPGAEPPLMGETPPAPAGQVRAGAAGTAGEGARTTTARGKPKPKTKARAKKVAATKSRPTGADLAGPSSEVYAEDWWKLSRPVFEFHGYYRVRSEFFHNFHLGRKDATKPMWPRPPDDDYIDTDGNPHPVRLCGDDPDPDAFERCDNNTQAGANMRFRLAPELHISDNVRIRSQIDLLDNIVLGSTPEGYANEPGESGRYAVVSRGGYSPTGAFVSTQWAPVGGINSTKDSIMVKRVWGEYSSPIGQIRFGRMPSHWGLGMLVNSGDGYDSDYQSTADRLMFTTGVKSWGLYFAAAWDFANEGAISAALNEQQGQPYDLAQSDDVDQWVFVIVRRMDEQLARKALKDGDPVFNGGGYLVYRTQDLANDTTDAGTSAALGQDPNAVAGGYTRRGAEAWIPDAWFQFRYDTFRLEFEGAMIWGGFENRNRTPDSDYVNTRVAGDDGWNLRQFGFALQAEYRALEEKLKIGFDFGVASGDSDVDNLAPVGNELQPQLTLDRTYSTFRFHPDYRVDLILWRNIYTRVQGAYFFKPSVGYDIFRDPDGQKLGGIASVIWSRASEFVQTPGHAHDLGVELNLKLYFQAKDGVLNDDPNEMGGFYTQLEYGVLFPLDGLGYLPGQKSDYATLPGVDEELDTETAQAVRWYLGILF
jgi:uncharacterized protein (TIGR04551 family)